MWINRNEFTIIPKADGARARVFGREVVNRIVGMNISKIPARRDDAHNERLLRAKHIYVCVCVWFETVGCVDFCNSEKQGVWV